MLKQTLKVVVMLCLMVILISSSVIGTEAGTKAVHEGPVVLKMNDYFIIYTYPKGPYIDENNRLIIPLRSVSDLLGADVAYDGPARTATVTMDGRTVQITIGSYTAIVDGEPVEMDTVAVIENGSMLIPARILFDSFNFKVEINPQGIAWIHDERLYTDEYPKAVADGEYRQEYDGKRHANDFFSRILVGNDFLGLRNMEEPNAFHPLYYEVVIEETNEDLKYLISACYKVQNISGQYIAYDSQEFEFSLFYKKMDMDSIGGSTHYLPSNEDDVFFVRNEFLSGQQIKYILAVGRTLVPQHGTRYSERQLP